MRYLVKHISKEKDGCKVQTDDMSSMAILTLKDENGGEITVEVPYKDICEKNISETDWVTFDFAGVLHKES